MKTEENRFTQNIFPKESNRWLPPGTEYYSLRMILKSVT